MCVHHRVRPSNEREHTKTQKPILRNLHSILEPYVETIGEAKDARRNTKTRNKRPKFETQQIS